MNKTNDLLLRPATDAVWATPGLDATSDEGRVRITDQRVVQLLLFLHEINESQKLEELPEPQLSELIGEAILACGFEDPVEARFAIASILEAIQAESSPTQSYS